MERKTIPKRLSTLSSKKKESLDSLTQLIGIILDGIETTPFRLV
jgi:hypothetical protein